HQPANFEAPGVVDGGLDSQYAALFVVHFDRVLFDPVFDAHSFGSTLNVTADLPVEAAVRVPAQKTQHVLATETLHGMGNQPRIDRLQAGGIAEQDISCVFSLTNSPVVAVQVQARLWIDPGIDPPGQGIQEPWRRPSGQAVEQDLGAGQVVDTDEAIVPLLITDSGSIHLACQIFASVDAYLNGERQPGLQTDVHQTEVFMNEIKIQVQALPLRRGQQQ